MYDSASCDLRLYFFLSRPIPINASPNHVIVKTFLKNKELDYEFNLTDQ